MRADGTVETERTPDLRAVRRTVSRSDSLAWKTRGRGWRLIRARYEGTCPVCRGPIRVLDQIGSQHGRPVIHWACLNKKDSRRH